MIFMKRNFNRGVHFLLSGIILLVGLGRAQALSVSRAQYLMGTICEITVITERIGKAEMAISKAFQEILDLDRMMSSYRSDSELSRVNAQAATSPVSTSPRLFEALSYSSHYAILTQNAFDPAVEPLIQLWDFRGEGRVPTKQGVQEALQKVGFEKIVLDDDSHTVFFRENGVGIDLGGIGKGYALDRAALYLKKEGFPNALLNFGGEILVLGHGPEGEDWKMEVADPQDRTQGVVFFYATDVAISTSGNSERFIEVDGKRYGHILDPRSGYPVKFNGSVTVIGPSATDADALSTALFVMGEKEGLKWLKKFPQIRAFYLVPDRSTGVRFAGTENLSNLGIVVNSEKTTLTKTKEEIK
ncbi:MAG: FAD:protein FMN transferase [Deltaproteobacteria bacterium]|nr:FAD:protein FMN transferase [Deltaproteobacteria bacterium]